MKHPALRAMLIALVLIIFATSLYLQQTDTPVTAHVVVEVKGTPLPPAGRTVPPAEMQTTQNEQHYNEVEQWN